MQVHSWPSWKVLHKKMMPWGGPGLPPPAGSNPKRKFDPVDFVTKSIESGTVQELFPDLFDISRVDAPADVPPKRTRETPARPDYWDSTWGRMLKKDKEKMLDQPHCSEAKLFRRRFRVPPRIFFDVFVPQVERIFAMEDRFAKFTVPAVFKALIVLRILGRDAAADDCTENSNVSEPACNRIFIKFLHDYSALYYDEYVYFPKPGSAELAKIMETSSESTKSSGISSQYFPNCSLSSFAVLHLPSASTTLSCLSSLTPNKVATC